ncbi:AraC family transcriptional regulator [Roseivirga thermotolerans]|jgi:AraC-like DNA-binding protein|uniref:Transcriptional regulator MtlR n=1 Tax=Roseivirga thermotolerans TaxID=1758176 RepID=A0ABQ3I262_9BACT|nr:AraC family transcriptional regulator [Roseivirga thermotolerans]GHE57230.1 transcriptional regulator MtlR [Roseivirga thermotolerans]
MKVLPFKIPKVENSSFHLQIDDEPYFYDKLHQHPELQLTWIVKGEGTLIYGDYLGEFMPNEVYLIGSNVPHVFRSKAEYYQQADKRVLAKTIFFKPDLVKKGQSVFPELSQLEGLLLAADRGLKINPTASPKLIHQMNAVFETNPLSRLGQILCLVDEFGRTESQVLSQWPQKPLKEQHGRRLDDVFKFTLENYHRPIQLEEVAEVVHMNKAAFCRYFKQHTRKTYLNFLNEIRLQKATELLKNSEMPIAQIAYEVGFNNLSNFNRTFKLMKGRTPVMERSRFTIA